LTDVSVGVLLALAAGVVNGSFAAPTKYATRWKWENIWAVWAVVALFFSPWALAFATVPNLPGFYHQVNSGFFVLLVTFGLGVGLAQVFFGLALAAVGLSIGFAVTIGLSTAIGSLVPLVLLGSRAVLAPKGLIIVAGVASVLLGTALCGLASYRKEKERLSSCESKTEPGATPKNFRTGLLLCVLAGVLSPLVNLALAFGSSLLRLAAQAGVSPSNLANVIWPPLLTATLVPYLSYCVYLWCRNKSWSLFTLAGTRVYWLFGVIMGLLWTGSLAVYGAASTRLAAMGPILGWPLFMSVIIITSNVWGFATAEWKGANRGAVKTMLVGILFLIVGFCTVALGSRLG
jgi:L-rhamnose-H+ transport protein